MRGGGVSMALAGARLGAALGPCCHPRAVAVTLSTGEVVAWLCPSCDRQLPHDWSGYPPPPPPGPGGGSRMVSARVPAR